MGGLSLGEITRRLEAWLEVEFTLQDVSGFARAIATLAADEQNFVLDWVQKLATAHVQLAHLFANRAPGLLARVDRRLIEAWLVEALDAIDSEGLQAAVAVLRAAERNLAQRQNRAEGVALADLRGILLTVARGFSGRRLQLEASEGETAWTDGETLHLPALMARLPSAADNFALYKALVAMLWAQGRFGTTRALAEDALSGQPFPERALACFNALETLRLEACIARELPGLGRDIRRFRQQGAQLPPAWRGYAERLGDPGACFRDSLELVPEALSGELPPPAHHQCELRPEAVAARIEREKMLLRLRLSELAGTPPELGEAEQARRFELRQREDQSGAAGELELFLGDAPLAPPEDVRQLLASVRFDFGEIPPEYLLAAGPGEYAAQRQREISRDPDQVWQGSYHEEGAILYPEWDVGRGHYRKNWCVMREKEVPPGDPDFIRQTLVKHGALVRRLRRSFESLRHEERLQKRQTHGEQVDLDALVEALSELRGGGEMSELLYARLSRSERNIAVAFLVDMSGSTKGWVNDAEREALVLMCEALEVLGDRYAIYGFSGMTRKKCELFRIKRFDDAYDEAVKARISGIRPQDYTRMGFALRHLSRLLLDVEVRSRLLITLTDGRPEDYNDHYRGEYGIADTRQALIEARRAGIHPFCITIDREGHDYLARLYGPARFVVLDQVTALPFKVAEIYRRLTI